LFFLVCFDYMQDMTNARDPHFTAAVHWNDGAILSAAGMDTDGPRAVIDLLSLHHQGTPTLNAVQQWSSRRRVPDRWRARLVYCLLREGRIATSDLFRRGPAQRLVPVAALRRRLAAPCAAA
jgi:hypothetical protein